MNRIKLVMLLAIFTVLLSGCSTSGTFVVPEGTDLYIYKRTAAVTVGEDGKVTTKPFFWTAAGGIPYRLDKEGQTIKEGKLRAKFRPAAIFWPPLGLIYWPIGFNQAITYDLVNDKQE